MGYLRLALALAVVLSHLSWEYGKFAGPIAVFGFYTLSGYLISGSIRDTYQGRPLSFVVNRALRIYPAYWAVMLIGLVIAMFGSPLSSAISIPQGFDDWWRQISILGLVGINGTLHPVRLVPPAWSLSIELFWYLAMFFLWKRAMLWLVASTIAAVCLSVVWGWQGGFYNYLGPSVCFALGAYCQQRQIRLPTGHIPFAICILAGLMVVGNFVAPSAPLLYLSAPATAYLIVSLPPGRSAGVEKLSGELAYPVFLCHWHVASLAGIGLGPLSLVVSLPLIFALSLAIVFGVEHPIAAVRNWVRKPGGTRHTPTSSVPT